MSKAGKILLNEYVVNCSSTYKKESIHKRFFSNWIFVISICVGLWTAKVAAEQLMMIKIKSEASEYNERK